MSTFAALLILAGAVLAFGGSLGLIRLKSFYERVHPPTMGTTLGAALIVCGAAIAAALESGPVLRYVLIGVFMLVTTPISYILLLAAARRRRG
jgi:multicomponent K+:H+ antiporter subunit G